jgi:hypothetical protein
MGFAYLWLFLSPKGFKDAKLTKLTILNRKSGKHVTQSVQTEIDGLSLIVACRTNHPRLPTVLVDPIILLKRIPLRLKSCLPPSS